MRGGTRLRVGLAVTLVAIMACAIAVGLRVTGGATKVTAYFESSNGIYPGDDVRILGVRVGKIDSIEPQPLRAKITFSFDSKYKVPADAHALILSPTLVTARFIQLAPVYTSGPVLQDNAVIPADRTAEPVEWDDVRNQLDKLNQSLQPTTPGGVSPLGGFVNTVADNLRGQGGNIRQTLIGLSQALSTLGDESGNVFGTVKNLSVLVSALRKITNVMQQFNQNLAAVSGRLSNDPNEVGNAVADVNTAVTDVRSFLSDNTEALGVTGDKLAEITHALGDSIDDVKQALHVFPTDLSNFTNSFDPAHASIIGGLSGTNFSNPINFLCGAIQAASRLRAEQSAKLCVQYLAPILKNRQYNFLGPIGVSGAPLGPTVFTPSFPIEAQARPNEITYSENWLRPDYVPPATPSTGSAASTVATDPKAGLPGLMVAPATPPGPPPAGRAVVPEGAAPAGGPPRAAEVPAPSDLPPPPAPTDPGAGLPGLMVPQGAHS